MCLFLLYRKISKRFLCPQNRAFSALFTSVIMQTRDLWNLYHAAACPINRSCFLLFRETGNRHTIISVCETPVAACSGWADPVAGFYADTSYPKSRICWKCPLGSFYDFCPLKLRQWRSECSSDTECVRWISCLPYVGHLCELVPTGRVCDLIT